MGSGKAKTPKKTAAVRENAKKPRGRWANTEERELIEKGKALGRAAVPELVNILLSIARNKKNSPEARTGAATKVLDRCGLPPVSHSEVKLDEGGMPVVLVKMGDGLGWTKPAEPAAGGE